MSFGTVEWKNGAAVILDQRKLPAEKTFLECSTHGEVADAIRSMAVRGAPAIGIAAAMGFALGAAENAGARTRERFAEGMRKVGKTLAQTRPTAANLFRALERMEKVISKNPKASPGELAGLLRDEAVAMRDEDLRICKKIGEAGAGLIKDGATVMTHCNAGALATAGYGTALGAVRAAHGAGKKVRVISPETRPLFQGARLTAWELSEDGIPVSVIADTAVGYAMANKMVDAVIVGADRIAANGDVANKIGTYQISVLAGRHGIGFHVAAPWSTVDMNCASGGDIPIEQRSATEVSHFGGARIAAEGAEIMNPAFDITPAENISSIITERGAAIPPCREEMERLARARQ